MNQEGAARRSPVAIPLVNDLAISHDQQSIGVSTRDKIIEPPRLAAEFIGERWEPISSREWLRIARMNCCGRIKCCCRSHRHRRDGRIEHIQPCAAKIRINFARARGRKQHRAQCCQQQEACAPFHRPDPLASDLRRRVSPPDFRLERTRSSVSG